MSFNLGNWAEKLTCELCDGEDDPDASADVDFDWDFDYDWDSYGEEGDQEDSGLFDDFPTGVPLGDNLELAPDWNNGPGIRIRGWW